MTATALPTSSPTQLDFRVVVELYWFLAAAGCGYFATLLQCLWRNRKIAPYSKRHPRWVMFSTFFHFVTYCGLCIIMLHYNGRFVSFGTWVGIVFLGVTYDVFHIRAYLLWFDFHIQRQTPRVFDFQSLGDAPGAVVAHQHNDQAWFHHHRQYRSVWYIMRYPVIKLLVRSIGPMWATITSHGSQDVTDGIAVVCHLWDLTVLVCCIALLRYDQVEDRIFLKREMLLAGAVYLVCIAVFFPLKYQFSTDAEWRSVRPEILFLMLSLVLWSFISGIYPFYMLKNTPVDEDALQHPIHGLSDAELFERIILNEYSLAALTLFLQCEFSEENLTFIRTCDAFSSMVKDVDSTDFRDGTGKYVFDQLHDSASTLVRQYVDQSSPSCVSLSTPVRNALLSEIAKGNSSGSYGEPDAAAQRHADVNYTSRVLQLQKYVEAARMEITRALLHDAVPRFREHAVYAKVKEALMLEYDYMESFVRTTVYSDDNGLEIEMAPLRHPNRSGSRQRTMSIDEVSVSDLRLEVPDMPPDDSSSSDEDDAEQQQLLPHEEAQPQPAVHRHGKRLRAMEEFKEDDSDDDTGPIRSASTRHLASSSAMRSPSKSSLHHASTAPPLRHALSTSSLISSAHTLPPSVADKITRMKAQETMLELDPDKMIQHQMKVEKVGVSALSRLREQEVMQASMNRNLRLEEALHERELAFHTVIERLQSVTEVTRDLYSMFQSSVLNVASEQLSSATTPALLRVLQTLRKYSGAKFIRSSSPQAQRLQESIRVYERVLESRGVNLPDYAVQGPTVDDILRDHVPHDGHMQPSHVSSHSQSSMSPSHPLLASQSWRKNPEQPPPLSSPSTSKSRSLQTSPSRSPASMSPRPLVSPTSPSPSPTSMSSSFARSVTEPGPRNSPRSNNSLRPFHKNASSTK